MVSLKELIKPIAIEYYLACVCFCTLLFVSSNLSIYISKTKTIWRGSFIEYSSCYRDLVYSS